MRWAPTIGRPSHLPVASDVGTPSQNGMPVAFWAAPPTAGLVASTTDEP